MKDGKNGIKTGDFLAFLKEGGILRKKGEKYILLYLHCIYVIQKRNGGALPSLCSLANSKHWQACFRLHGVPASWMHHSVVGEHSIKDPSFKIVCQKV